MDVPTLAKRRCASPEPLPLALGASTENASGASVVSGVPAAARDPLPGVAAAAGLPPRGRTTRRASRRSVCGSHGSAASGTGAAPGAQSASSVSSSSRSRCPHTKHVNTSRLTRSGAWTCTRSSPCAVATTTVSGSPGDGVRGGADVCAGAVLASGGDALVRLWCAMSSCGGCWCDEVEKINFGCGVGGLCFEGKDRRAAGRACLSRAGSCPRTRRSRAPTSLTAAESPLRVTV